MKAVLIGLSGYLWRMGGSDEFPKLVRRLGCAILIGIAVAVSKNWFGILSIPLFYGAFTLGYGVNSPLIKLFQNKYIVRYICGFLYCMPALLVMWGNWWLFGYYMIVVPCGIMLAGNQKFGFEDMREEYVIGLMVCSLPILV